MSSINTALQLMNVCTTIKMEILRDRLSPIDLPNWDEVESVCDARGGDVLSISDFQNYLDQIPDLDERAHLARAILIHVLPA